MYFERSRDQEVTSLHYKTSQIVKRENLIWQLIFTLEQLKEAQEDRRIYLVFRRYNNGFTLLVISTGLTVRSKKEE